VNLVLYLLLFAKQIIKDKSKTTLLPQAFYKSIKNIGFLSRKENHDENNKSAY